MHTERSLLQTLKNGNLLFFFVPSNSIFRPAPNTIIINSNR